jgi:DNA (cytosine-5)-methyltransferase 1
MSLCTGVAGLELGIRLVYPEARLACCCEWEAYAATDLLARMEEEALEPAPDWCDDLAEFDGRPWAGAVDIITAGFPCQPFSSAGKRRGTADNRWIWPDIARIIRQVGPDLVFLENVPGITNSGLEHVLGALAQSGFNAEWDVFSAGALGFTQERKRWFCLAYRHGFRYNRRWKEWTGGIQPENDRRNPLAHRHGAREPQLSRDLPETRKRPSYGNEKLVCLDSKGRQTRRDHIENKENLPSSCPPNHRTHVTKLLGHGNSGGLERRMFSGQNRAGWSTPWPPGPGCHEEWKNLLQQDPTIAPAIEPPVLRMVDGVSEELDKPDEFRSDRIRCLGNSVVPVVAAVAFTELSRRIRANQKGDSMK